MSYILTYNNQRSKVSNCCLLLVYVPSSFSSRSDTAIRNQLSLIVIDQHDLYTHLQQPKIQSIQLLSVIGLCPLIFLLLIRYSNKKPIVTDRPTCPIYSPTTTKNQEYPTAVCYWSMFHHRPPLDQIQQ